VRQLRTEQKATSAADSGIRCCRTWYVPGMYIVTCDSLEFINKLGVQRSMPVTQQKMHVYIIQSVTLIEFIDESMMHVVTDERTASRH